MSPNFIFLNSVGRLRSGWRFSIFTVLFIAFVLTLEAFIVALLLVLGISLENITNSSTGFISLTLARLCAAVFIGWVCLKAFEGLPLVALGWNFSSLWWRDLLLGFVVGSASLLLATGIAALGGGLTFIVNPAGFAAVGQTLLVSLGVFAFGAASEEALFRGYPLQTFTRARLVWVAILITSVFFALAHAYNPSATIFSLINTGLAGVWFVVAYLKTRTLWFAFAIHWSWNWVLGAIMGLPVSGLKYITPQPVLLGIDNGPTWLTGGHYGIEGGAACTVALLVSTAVIWFLPFLKPTPEMLALTSQENPVQSETTSILS
jgi:uncharacterized protein